MLGPGRADLLLRSSFGGRRRVILGAGTECWGRTVPRERARKEEGRMSSLALAKVRDQRFDLVAVRCEVEAEPLGFVERQQAGADGMCPFSSMPTTHCRRLAAAIVAASPSPRLSRSAS